MLTDNPGPIAWGVGVSVVKALACRSSFRSSLGRAAGCRPALVVLVVQQCPRLTPGGDSFRVDAVDQRPPQCFPSSDLVERKAHVFTRLSDNPQLADRHKVIP